MATLVYNERCGNCGVAGRMVKLKGNNVLYCAVCDSCRIPTAECNVCGNRECVDSLEEGTCQECSDKYRITERVKCPHCSYLFEETDDPDNYWCEACITDLGNKVGYKNAVKMVNALKPGKNEEVKNFLDILLSTVREHPIEYCYKLEDIVLHLYRELDIPMPVNRYLVKMYCKASWEVEMEVGANDRGMAMRKALEEDKKRFPEDITVDREILSIEPVAKER